MRIRSIKPDFFKHDRLAELPALSRILFIGLWCMADCEGRMEDRPKRIKAEVLPYDDADIDGILTQLAASGFIFRYQVDGNSLIEIPNFRKHQRISGKESDAQSTLPPRKTGKQRGSTREALGKHPESLEGKGREGKGIGKEGTRERVVGDEWIDLLPDRLKTDGFKVAWTKYADYRKRRKFTPLLPESIEAQFRTLAEYGPDIARLAIDATIANGWQGIFPEKIRPNGQTPKGTKENLEVPVWDPATGQTSFQ